MLGGLRPQADLVAGAFAMRIMDFTALELGVVLQQVTTCSMPRLLLKHLLGIHH